MLNLLKVNSTFIRGQNINRLISFIWIATFVEFYKPSFKTKLKYLTTEYLKSDTNGQLHINSVYQLKAQINNNK